MPLDVTHRPVIIIIQLEIMDEQNVNVYALAFIKEENIAIRNKFKIIISNYICQNAYLCILHCPFLWRNNKSTTLTYSKCLSLLNWSDSPLNISIGDSLWMVYGCIFVSYSNALTVYLYRERLLFLLPCINQWIDYRNAETHSTIKYNVCIHRLCKYLHLKLLFFIVYMFNIYGHKSVLCTLYSTVDYEFIYKCV